MSYGSRIKCLVKLLLQNSHTVESKKAYEVEIMLNDPNPCEFYDLIERV